MLEDRHGQEFPNNSPRSPNSKRGMPANPVELRPHRLYGDGQQAWITMQFDNYRSIPGSPHDTDDEADAAGDDVEPAQLVAGSRRR